MTDIVADIALRRLRLVAVPTGSGLSRGLSAAWLAELTKLGFRVPDPSLLAAAAPTLVSHRAELVATLRAMKGGDVPYVPLFSRFPDDVPDDDDLLARRIVGYLGRMIGAFEEPPSWLFDLGDYGADPITQLQTEQATAAGRADQAGRAEDTHVEWIDLQLVRPDVCVERVHAWLLGNLYAKASIREGLRDDLRAVLRELGVARVDPERLLFKENRTFVLRFLWEAGDLDAAARLISTPTDLLRLFAALTDTDVSLSSSVRFPKLTRAQRRFVLGCLERAPRLAEDLHRYEGLWKAVGRSLHVGEHQSRFPLTAEAFDALRRGRIRTFDGRTRALVEAGDLPGLLEHLQERPGVLGRMVHELLRRWPARSDRVLAALEQASPQLQLKQLLVMRAYFSAINELEHRTVITKRGRIKVLDNNARGALDDAVLATLRRQLDEAIGHQLGGRAAWTGQPVWIDPLLDQLTVPLQQRAASDGLLTLGRGSRLPLALDGKVLRLFVWWKQQARTTDLDLSAIAFGADLEYLGHVSYTQLKGQGMAHSGDLQSAPHGAAEFIDLDLSGLGADVAYVASSIYRYAGESFTQATCHAGWMIRQEVDAAYASFDVKTVQHRFDVSGQGAYCIPVLIDVRRHEAVLTDLYVGSRAFANRVESSSDSVGTIAREISRFTTFRPTLGDLVRLHVGARGARLVTDAQAADTTFGVGPSHTFDVTDTARVLSELL